MDVAVDNLREAGGSGAVADSAAPEVPPRGNAIINLILGRLLATQEQVKIGAVAAVPAMNQDKPGYQSVISQILAAIMGRNWLYFVTISSVLAVLCLSANTSFVDFPRLCRLTAAHDVLPRGFAIVGRRLVYSVGVLVLAICAGFLLVVFGGITDRLIPLFAVGAFLAFSLSQAGMVMHWRRELKSGSGRENSRVWIRLCINGIGTVSTGIALLIILEAL